jgi:hypothetical protein
LGAVVAIEQADTSLRPSRILVLIVLEELEILSRVAAPGSWLLERTVTVQSRIQGRQIPPPSTEPLRDFRDSQSRCREIWWILVPDRFSNATEAAAAQQQERKAIER